MQQKAEKYIVNFKAIPAQAVEVIAKHERAAIKKAKQVWKSTNNPQVDERKVKTNGREIASGAKEGVAPTV